MAARKSFRTLSCRPAATLKTIDQLTEYPGTGPGSLSFKIPHSHWRVESTSGATTATEWSLQIIQTMDESAGPAAVTSLTTTNANVSQVGSSYVIGAVKDATPALNITYRYTGTPTHFLMGFAPRTAYHVVNAGGTVTIGPATGTGDMMTSAAGLLIFPAQPEATLRYRALAHAASADLTDYQTVEFSEFSETAFSQGPAWR